MTNEQIQNTETEEPTTSFSRARRLGRALNSLAPGVLAKVASVPATGFSFLAARELFTNDQVFENAADTMRFGGPATLAIMGITSVIAARSMYRQARQPAEASLD